MQKKQLRRNLLWVILWTHKYSTWLTSTTDFICQQQRNSGDQCKLQPLKVKIRIWARACECSSPPATNTCFEYEMTAPSLVREYLPDGGRRVQYILYILGLALLGWKYRGILLISLPSASRQHNSRTFWPTGVHREGSGGDDGQSVCTCMFVSMRVNKPAVNCGRSAACSWPWSIRYGCQDSLW